MTTPHRATTEVWELLRRGKRFSLQSATLELADRLAAAEQRISELESAENYRQQDEDAERAAESAAPAGSLVEVVAEAIIDGMVTSDQQAARAAILSVAGWLRDHEVIGHACRQLREEVDRRG